MCNPNAEVISRRQMQGICKDIPFSSDPLYRPSPKPSLVTERPPLSNIGENIKINHSQNIDFGVNKDINLQITSQINTDYEEKSPYQ